MSFHQDLLSVEFYSSVCYNLPVYSESRMIIRYFSPVGAFEEAFEIA